MNYQDEKQGFCFWLQGFFEVSNAKVISEEQVELIKNHLNLVFAHEIDPEMGDKIHQDKLNNIHKPTFIQEPKPSDYKPHWQFGTHGWYDPKEGLLRC